MRSSLINTINSVLGIWMDISPTFDPVTTLSARKAGKLL